MQVLERSEGDRDRRVASEGVAQARHGDPSGQVIARVPALEGSLAGIAFMSLSKRWQAVLWLTEVECEAPSELVLQFGINAAAVAALAYRAREGLKQAYLQAHITGIDNRACRPCAGRP